LNFLENFELKIGEWNTRSMRRKINNVEDLLRQHQFDIFVIIETWLKDGWEWRVEIEGYQLLVLNRTSKKGGGIAVYIREGIKFDPSKTRKSAQGLPFEYLWINVVEPVKVDVVSVYIPKANKSHMEDLFARTFPLIRSDSNIVVVGDFNLPYSENQNYLAKVEKELQVKQIIELPTHMHGNTLDHIYVDNTENAFKVENHGVIHNSQSDHYVTFCTLNIFPHHIDRKAIAGYTQRPFIQKDDCGLNTFKCQFKSKNCILPCNSGNGSRCRIFESKAELQKHLEKVAKLQTWPQKSGKAYGSL